MSLARSPLPLILCVTLMVALCVTPGAADPRANRVERVANRGAAWDGAGAGVGVAAPVDRSTRYLSGAYCANVQGGGCKRTQTQLERVRRGPRQSPRQVLRQVPRQRDPAQPFAWEE